MSHGLTCTCIYCAGKRRDIRRQIRQSYGGTAPDAIEERIRSASLTTLRAIRKELKLA